MTNPTSYRWLQRLFAATDNSCHHDDDTGDVVQTGIVAVALLMLVLGGLQTALYYHARNTLTAASQAGLQASRGQQQSAGQGQAAALELIRKGSGHLVASPSVMISRSATTVTVTVTGHVQSVIPGISFPTISAHAQGPVERVTH